MRDLVVVLTSPKQDFNTEGTENTEKAMKFSRQSRKPCFSFSDSMPLVASVLKS